MADAVQPDPQLDAVETREWLDSLDEVLSRGGPERVRQLMRELAVHAHNRAVRMPISSSTPYINSIPFQEQPPYPGNREMERRIKNVARWNAMAMVVRANREKEGIGGHISTYASAATLYEVGFNHFFRGRTENHPGDIIYFQGHAAPGIYSRAFIEGRLSVEHLRNFRQELGDGPGLSSYPHPWLMPTFWNFPTVSMGLGPITAIYHARFIKYLEDRGLKAPSDQKVWAFLGDGETDEPESLGAITLASREKLENLVFVINCNLQRLDGPVRGNGKIIQELEAAFRGAGWNVIKVVWGNDWDALLEKDEDGALVRRMGEVVDGQYQKYVVEDGAFIREDFFGKDPRLREMVKHLSDEQLQRMRRGGHDPDKVYAAYKAAMNNRAAPTVILAKTIKGYGLGESAEGKNVTHQQKKLNESELLAFRTRFQIPLSDDEVNGLPFYRFADDSPEAHYMQERRKALGGFQPMRHAPAAKINTPGDATFAEFREGTGDREVSTTMAFVRMLAKLLRDPVIGKLIVPIVPDEARTFGMEALFRQCGIYSHLGQLYEPVDKDNLLYYKEARDGQILEEGITEAGSLSSFIAAGTAYSVHSINTIPFYIYYSMFGLQRVGDLVWAAADSRCKGFLLGATAGRTTLSGEGLQHQDGHSHVLALPVPNLMAYDPAFAYEVAVIIQQGMHRMYAKGDDVFYYITLMNENYLQPPMPAGCEEGILKGMYRFRASPLTQATVRTRLMGSGAILNETLKAAAMLEERYGVAADVWSVTSYKELYKDAIDVDRWNLHHPGQHARVPYVTQCLREGSGPVVSASDYIKALAETVGRWIPGRYTVLGTDGFGRSDGRVELRRFFEVDSRYITLAALAALARDGELSADVVTQALQDLEIDPATPNPMTI
ncbi:MAG: pyruvate dehydrogenase (acetyl-transferring), homodimeric type [Verrucomicrobia bacterium]|nr:pyruvate dehydrogenase (acetyl-transferring), homodimeric type [Verrucomicrobiota bacterium]